MIIRLSNGASASVSTKGGAGDMSYRSEKHAYHESSAQCDGVQLRVAIANLNAVPVCQYYRQRRQTCPTPHTTHLRTPRMVLLDTQTPRTRVLPTPHP
jgi:hypothetical protein